MRLWGYMVTWLHGYEAKQQGNSQRELFTNTCIKYGYTLIKE